MRLLLPVLLVLAIPLAGGAAEVRDRPEVDPEAIREALRASPRGESYASSRAYAHYLAARMAEGEGNLERALEELRLAVIYDDASPELRVALAWVYARSDDLARAVEEVHRAVRADPGNAEAHLLLGKIRGAQHRKAEAVRSFERAIALRPDGAEAWLALVRLHADFGAWGDAEAVAERFEKVHTRDAGPWRLLAAVSWERDDLRLTRRYLRRAVLRDPDDTGSRLRLAHLEAARGADRQAAKLYADVLRLDPSETEALLGSGRLALRRGDLVTARAYFQQMLGTSRDPVTAALQVSGAFRALHMQGDALATIDDALGADPAEPRLHFTRGVVLGALGRHADAAKAFSAVDPSAGPLYVAALARLADVQSLEGRHDEARRSIQRALALLAPGAEEGGEIYGVVPDVFRRAGKPVAGLELLEPLAAQRSDPALLVAVAESLQDLGRHAQAQALLAARLVETPGEEQLVFALAAARERAGDVEGAVGLVQALLRGDPDNASALNFVGYVLADRGLRLEEARTLLQRAVELRPDEPYYLDSLGWCEVRRGNVEAGARMLERARRLAPRDAAVLHHLADAYHRLGRSGDAQSLWDEALQLLDRDPDPRMREEIEAARREAGQRAARR